MHSGSGRVTDSAKWECKDKRNIPFSQNNFEASISKDEFQTIASYIEMLNMKPK